MRNVAFLSFSTMILVCVSCTLKNVITDPEDKPPAGMKLVEGGSFQMGDATAGGIEQPVHTVSVASFFIDSTEVTQADYQELTGINPSEFQDTISSNRPVEMVTWYDAVLYCNARSKRDGRDTVYSYTGVTGTARDGRSGLGNLVINLEKNGYRLPTEAEWEYACRAGTTSHYYWDVDSALLYAWYIDNSAGSTHNAASKLPNTNSLYDMSGNVWEMCNDWFGTYGSAAQSDPSGPGSGTAKIIRGGCWSRDSTYLRSAARLAVNPGARSNDVGFRVCVAVR